jgi:hypothetical protein
VEEFVLLLKKAGPTPAQYAIQFFAFVPDPTGYVTVLHKTDGSLTRCAWHNVPPALDTVLEREASKGVRHVTVGVTDGSYAVILNSGVVCWGSGVPAPLHQLLEDAERSRRRVAVGIISLFHRAGTHSLNYWLNLPKTVTLSLISSGWYFVGFEDGATAFSLPPGWYDSINKWYDSINNHTTQPLRVGALGGHIPKMATSYYTGVPFASNPYLASAFTGVPQQPVYNIPQVFNMPQVYYVPQQQQQQQQQDEPSTLEKYNGLFTLLGGALKLAGAVLGSEFVNNVGTGSDVMNNAGTGFCF